ncbi:hypothetical protein CC86DRAFT_403727 [Ophiobolus disseminans]|uniref:Uncharacterized protein n=1 Tax=Ophiobolus disseminans TaxID=1469910 RepID=A0A6A7A7B6_9PLEO|nr:hypothetical protein CC86DRAFT_403727 [Ophiobolus disseminans]
MPVTLWGYSVGISTTDVGVTNDGNTVKNHIKLSIAGLLNPKPEGSDIAELARRTFPRSQSPNEEDKGFVGDPIGVKQSILEKMSTTRLEHEYDKSLDRQEEYSRVYNDLNLQLANLPDNDGNDGGKAKKDIDLRMEQLNERCQRHELHRQLALVEGNNDSYECILIVVVGF